MRFLSSLHLRLVAAPLHPSSPADALAGTARCRRPLRPQAAVSTQQQRDEVQVALGLRRADQGLNVVPLTGAGARGLAKWCFLGTPPMWGAARGPAGVPG